MPQKFRLKIATTSRILSEYKIHEAVELLGKIGYDAIEIWATCLEHQLKKRMTSIPKIKSALHKYKMTGTIHGPAKDRTLDYKSYNLCSKDKKWRNKSLQKNLAAMDYADKLGFKVIVVHPGHMDSPADTIDETYWQLQIDAFKQLAKKAAKLNLDMGVELMENRAKEFVTNPPALHKIIKAVKSKHIGVTFDITHAFTHGDNNHIEFLDGCREHIFHAHMSGYTKDKTHVPFNMSIIPSSYLDAALKKLVQHHAGWITIEGLGIIKGTKANQKKVAIENLEYILRELKSLHLL